MRAFVWIISALFALSACNTMAGLGRDIEGAGNAINRSANNTKENMKD